ncbi:hypothetical protein COLO4_22153 [Corchorus olitorius]|uniref:Protein kinase domain-containing protein n=1 Tax=Corchorus olitorius TaxID=93759 RepID=A0A1R3INR9_9ROSI|nr:hypothetical protein COLO4_22153 [Corchorus olitorius]
MAMYLRRLSPCKNLFSLLNQQVRSFARDPFPNKLTQYLHQAKLIDSIRLALRSGSPNSINPLLQHRLLDSLVVTNALRSAPSVDSAVSLMENLKQVPNFEHSHKTIFAYATVLAKFQRTEELKAFIGDIKGGKFKFGKVSFMNLLFWYFTAGDLDEVLTTYEQYKSEEKRLSTEAYNIVIGAYAQKDKLINKVRREEMRLPFSALKLLIEFYGNSKNADAALKEPNVMNLQNISDVFGTSPQEIARASNLPSEYTQLFPGQLLLVPITCGCTRKHYFANITYDIKLGDTYYIVSTTTFESLVNWSLVEDMNPGLDPGKLQIGDQVVFPLFCKCPSKAQVKNRILLIHQRKKIFKRNGSSMETVGLIPAKELTRSESFKPMIQDKLLPGISGYLGKPIMYEADVIMGATMNLNEHCRIGGSVYRANIDGKLLAIKRTKDDVTEELKILQKVNHANLVKLMGISADSDGNCYLVYEYAENGSLDKWLHSKSSSSSRYVAFLTWSQRLQVALDVANGLQYMHEHTQPNIIHRDIRTSNILLDSTFRAKIANFSVARTTTNNIMPKVDVFAFGVVLLELLSGKKGMATKENGEISMLWKNLREVLENEDKEKRLRKWMDPNLESFYPIDGALSLAILAMACTEENPLARPSMGEIVFSLTVLIQSSFETLEGSWALGLEPELAQIISPVKAR